MNPFIQSLLHALKLPRWRRALVVALISDAVGFVAAPFPPLQWLVDAFTAVLLFAVLGFRWSLVSVLAIEVVPGLEMFPLWTLAILAMAATQKETAPGIKEVVRDSRSVESTNKATNQR